HTPTSPSRYPNSIAAPLATPPSPSPPRSAGIVASIGARAQMPPYEVLVMAKAAVQRRELADLVRGLAQRVISDGGVVMAVKSYGTVRLAYDVKKRDGWHQQGQVVQLEVNAPASLAQQLEHLNKDERLLRWLLLKSRPKRWMVWRGEALQSTTTPPSQFT
ncbi:unnamed protein product, partial [Closterium sp. Naga37s-1]